MKKNHLKTIVVAFIAFAFSFSSIAQISAERLKQYIDDNRYFNDRSVKEFYTVLNYNTAWVQKNNLNDRNILLNTLKQSAGMGLRETDYHPGLMDSLRNNTIRLQTENDLLEAEISITVSAIHFYSDIAYGNTPPAVGYNGLNYIPGCQNIPVLLAGYILDKKLQLLIAKIAPPLPEIFIIEKQLKWMNAVMSDSNFREVIITSNKVNETNLPLIIKLYQLGVIDAPGKSMPDSTLKLKLKEAQQQFNLPEDASLKNPLMQQLNVPLAVRVQQLALSVNYYRWLNCLNQSQSVIVVNIPAAYLKVYRHNGTILEMRVIVGKRSTPTPTLTSRINEVILYPYWHVPYSIATKELLPAIKRNTGVINAGNYQVLNSAGKIVDPGSVNWQALSAGNFPYIIRQSTGCDNSLGLLKLNFYNPFDVYLHDTPGKNLFKKNMRFFSHGCMRMEKPTDLGHLVLKNNHNAIDTLEQKGCLRHPSPIIVKAEENMPVIVWYNPAGIDMAGRLVYYGDIYGKFKWMKDKLPAK